MKGFSSVRFSEVSYIGVNAALYSFKYLDSFPSDVYIRGVINLTESDIDSYHNALNIPYDDDYSYYRIIDPLLIYVFEGIEYIINGNSRLKFLETKIESGFSELNIADIPYRFVESDAPLSTEQIVKLQTSANDFTRKHKSFDLYKRIAGFIDTLKTRGVFESEARKKAAAYFSVSEQTLSNAIKIMNSEQVLIDLINADLCTTDAANLIIIASEKTGLSIQNTLESIAHPKAIDDIKFKSSIIKAWRTAYEKIHGTRESRIDELIDSNKKESKDGIIRVQVTGDEDVQIETAEIQIDVSLAIANIEQRLNSPLPSPKNFQVLGGILSVLPSKLKGGDNIAFFNSLLDIIKTYAVVENLTPHDLDALSKALKSLEIVSSES